MRGDRGRRLPVHAGGCRRRAVLRDRVRVGELVGAVSGLGLLVVTFLPWYSVGGENATAWQAFSVTDIVLAAAGATALSVGIVVLFRLSVSYPVAGSSVAGGLGIVALVLIVIRLIDPPGSGDVHREIGAWLGLIAAAGIACGGWLGMQESRSPGGLRRPPTAAI
ncbi:MAG TPA: hypothetical protein VHR38_09480 [Solirubrobacterales bacterium]|nr:hypothetical protein [Solirubrobacterales bacterium]